MPIKIGGDAKAAAEATAGFTPLPEGNYLFNIYEVEESEYSEKSKNPGKPRLVVTLKVAEGDFAGRQVKDFNIPLFATWSSGATAHTFYQFAKAIGATLDDEGNVEFPVEEWSDLLGSQLKARVIHEFDDDDADKTNPRARVGRYLAPDTAITPVVKEPVAAKPNKFTSKK